MPTTLVGNPPSNWTAAYGGAPTVPDPSSTAAAAISGNIGNLAALYGMAGNVNQFQNAQALQNLTSNLPGYQGMVDQSSRNILQNLQGQVSGDVINQLLQGAAERGISTGQGAPGANTNAAYLRALGLTSLGLQKTGEEQLTAAIARTPTVAPMDLSKFMVGADEAQQAQMAANLYASAPNPAAAAAARQAAALQGLNSGRSAAGGAPTMSWAPSNWFGGGGGASNVLNSSGTGYWSNGQYITGQGESWDDWYRNLNQSGWVTNPATEEDIWNYMGVDLNGPPATTEADVWGDMGVDLYGAPSGTTSTDTSSFYDYGLPDYYG